MELLVLSTLKWKMQALTPFSFVDYFIKKITCDQLLVKSSILRSVGLILDIIRCIYSLHSVSMFSFYCMHLRNNAVIVGKNLCRYQFLGIQAFWNCCSSGNFCVKKTASRRDWWSLNMFCQCRKGNNMIIGVWYLSSSFTNYLCRVMNLWGFHFAGKNFEVSWID